MHEATSQGRHPEKKFLSLGHKALQQVHDVLPEADDGDGLPAGQPPVELLQGEADAGGQGAELGRGSGQGRLPGPPQDQG